MGQGGDHRTPRKKREEHLISLGVGSDAVEVTARCACGWSTEEGRTSLAVEEAIEAHLRGTAQLGPSLEVEAEVLELLAVARAALAEAASLLVQPQDRRERARLNFLARQVEATAAGITDR